MLMVIAAEGYGLYLAAYRAAGDTANLYGAGSCHDWWGPACAGPAGRCCRGAPACLWRPLLRLWHKS
jgi:hypothetical protein